ncbi:MAG: DUF3798 domain-containing protein [Clostridiales bacterium]|nr:DUF3798 domain-containing protein [Clostridiales bacterium]
MSKLSQALAVIMVLILAILLAACTGTATETDPPSDDSPVEMPLNILLDIPIGDSTDYHIGIVTLPLRYCEDENLAAEALIAQYGKVEDGGMIKHVVLPNELAQEAELNIPQIISLKDDPLMKAVIVNPGVQGTAAAFQKIREAGRDDILLIANMSQDDPVVISQVADVIVDSDNVLRGYYDILRAKNMGAKTFVHMSFPRHMSVYVLARRKAIYEEACNDLGLEFLFETIPDPVAGDFGVSMSRQPLYDTMPRLIEKYGKDAAYFTTNIALHERVIRGVVELGAIFVDSDDISPICGFPSALGVDLSDVIGDWPAIVAKIEDAVVAKGMSGRVGCWPYSFAYTAGIGLFEFAKATVEGTAADDTLSEIVKAFQVNTPGCDWVSGVFKYPDGSQLNNYYLLAMDTYIFGQGYSGVLSEPFPEKYYSIEPQY